MTTRTSRRHQNRQRTGFTLVEMSSAIAVMMILSFALVVMLQQHILFLDMFKRQNFLVAEAPTIGNMVGRIINQADHYFVYANRAAALDGQNPLLDDGKAVRLFFKSANQKTLQRLIAVEPGTGGKTLLRFYGWDEDGNETVPWTISDRINDASFVSNEGILNMTLNGPNGEQITYGGGVK